MSELSSTNLLSNKKPDEVIVLVAPSIHESYYTAVFEQTLNYQIEFVNTARPYVPTILVVDNATLPSVQGRIPDENIIVASIHDIWVRDFSPVFPPQPVQFSYRPNYLAKADSQWIENSFIRWSNRLDIDIAQSSIILDGGNFVHNGRDKAILTNRVFADNPTMSKNEIDAEIKQKTGIEMIAYIPEEPEDTTGHSDGMVMWIDDNILVIGETTDSLQADIIAEVERVFPQVKTVVIPVDYVRKEWDGFLSACGLHVNALVTDRYIFLPTYGQSNDMAVQTIIEAESRKEVITIDASAVCFMGGATRCLTWYAQGRTAATILDTVMK